MRKRRHREKQRLLWDGQYKPYFEQLDLDDIDPDKRIDEKEFTRRWWSFLDELESVLRSNP